MKIIAGVLLLVASLFGCGELLFAANSVTLKAVVSSPEGVRYVDNGDGTVTDKSTDLMWEKDGSGAGVVFFTETGNVTWAGAIAYCENLSLAGYTDWRLPNINELNSIVDYSRNPTIDPVFINNGNSNYDEYWSSTTEITWRVPDWAWRVSATRGSVNMDAKARFKFVRAVRDAA